MSVHRWDRLTREEVTALTARAVLVLPVAAIEQHGPHLAVRTDTAILEAILDLALPLVPGEVNVLVAPLLCYGASDHHLPFGGTLSLTTTTLRSVLADLVRSAAAAGCKRILLVNGHGGNTLTCGLIASDAAARHGIIVSSASYWDLIEGNDLGFPLPGHAGHFETSLMLEVDASLVRTQPQMLPKPVHDVPLRGMQLVRPDFWQRIDGFTDDPRSATAAMGQALLEQLASAVASAIVAVARA